MNLKIGAEAAQFPEKESINGIFVAVQLVVPLARNQLTKRKTAAYLYQAVSPEDNIYSGQKFFCVKHFSL
jgi:hypothetical protein